MSPILLLAGGLVVLVLIGAVVFALTRGNRQTKEEQQLEELSTMFESEWQPAEGSQASDDVNFREQMLERFDNALQDQGMAGNMRAALRKANLKLTVVEYLMLHGILAFGLGFIGFIIFGGPVQGAIFAVVGFLLPRFYVRFRQNKRLKDFNNQLADILQLWVNALRAGFSVPQAMETVSREAPNPAAEEFKRVVAEMSIGVPMETALNNMLSRIESEDLDLVFTAVNIQREVGGNLAEILDTISHTIRERVRIKGEIKVLTSQGRITGIVIAALPLFLGVVLILINPDYMGLILYGSPRGASIPVLNIPCGWPMIALGLFMMGLGVAAIRTIVDIEV